MKRRDPASIGGDVVKGRAVSTMDYVYLKNVLLQFLEQKDKKLQQMLIPVLAQLLNFDRCVGPVVPQ